MWLHVIRIPWRDRNRVCEAMAASGCASGPGKSLRKTGMWAKFQRLAKTKDTVGK